MEAETWLSPDQAMEYGIATEIADDNVMLVVQDAKKSIMQRVLNKPDEKNHKDDHQKEPAEKTLREKIKNMI